MHALSSTKHTHTHTHTHACRLQHTRKSQKKQKPAGRQTPRQRCRCRRSPPPGASKRRWRRQSRAALLFCWCFGGPTTNAAGKSECAAALRPGSASHHKRAFSLQPARAPALGVACIVIRATKQSASVAQGANRRRCWEEGAIIERRARSASLRVRRAHSHSLSLSLSATKKDSCV